MAIRKPSRRKPEIDLTGPQGNAYFLLGTARNLGEKLGWDKVQIESIITQMKSSDYENLIKTFDKHFGDLVDLVREIYERLLRLRHGQPRTGILQLLGRRLGHH